MQTDNRLNSLTTDSTHFAALVDGPPLEVAAPVKIAALPPNSPLPRTIGGFIIGGLSFIVIILCVIPAALGQNEIKELAGRTAKTILQAEVQNVAEVDRVAFVKGNTSFACDLYGKLLHDDGNVVFSPFSISMALAMTRAGARGQTAEQMAKVLHLTLPRERLHSVAGALIHDLAGTSDGKKRSYQLNVANALWGQKDYGFLNEFDALTRSKYGAGLTEVDFTKAGKKARGTINGWVEQQTQNRVKDLLQESHLTADTRLVLTNAIYFQAEWATKFSKKETTEQPFHLTADRKVKVQMMDRTGMGFHLDGDSFQMVELPYTGKELSMLVLLPKKVDGLSELQKSLTAEKLTAWHDKLLEGEIRFLLPRFKVTGTFELSKALIEMGMELPFSVRADFSGMYGGREPLRLSAMVHKTFVAVDEEGTEAAASSAIAMGRAAPFNKIVTFRADHPFVFIIRDNRSGSILFLGRVVDPTRSD